MNPRYILAHAALESGWGTSSYAKAGNFFGIGAFDSNPDNAYNYGNSNMEKGLINGAVWIRKNFYDAGQTTLYKMRHNGGKHEYATDPEWDKKIANLMDQLPANTGASYHDSKSTGDSDSSSSSSSSDSLLSGLDDLVLSYYSDQNRDFIKALFGLNSNSSSSDDNSDSDSSSSSGSDIGSGAAKKFHDKYLGKWVDVDGAYGAQCVDLFSQFKIDNVDGKPSYGNANELYNRYGDTPGFKKVPLSEGRYGDWAVWNKGRYGHVGMLLKREGNGKALIFGQNQNNGGNTARGKAASDDVLYEKGIVGLLRPTSGSGSGKKKITQYLNSLNGQASDNKKNKPENITFPISKKTLPNVNYDYLHKTDKFDFPMDNSDLYSGKGTGTKNNQFGKQLGDSAEIGASMQSNSNTDALINRIIDILSIIADNSSKLSEIVTLLSKALDVNLTDQDISKLSSNNAQIKNKIANALKSQGSPNGVGNTIMNSSTQSLADAMYSIARA